MNTRIIPAQTVTIETIKEILSSEHYELKPLEEAINDEGYENIIIVDMPVNDIAIRISPTHSYAMFTANYEPQEQLLDKLLLHANYLNQQYVWASFFIDKEEGSYGINAIYGISYKAGLNPFTFIDSLKTFHNAVGLAMDENVDTTINDVSEE